MSTYCTNITTTTHEVSTCLPKNFSRADFEFLANSKTTVKIAIHMKTARSCCCPLMVRPVPGGPGFTNVGYTANWRSMGRSMGSVRLLLPETNRSRATDPDSFHGCFLTPERSRTPGERRHPCMGKSDCITQHYSADVHHVVLTVPLLGRGVTGSCVTGFFVFFSGTHRCWS